jgi:hypothetical protein
MNSLLLFVFDSISSPSLNLSETPIPASVLMNNGFSVLEDFPVN